MKSNFEQLRTLVISGQVQLKWTLAMPRVNSTAVLRSFNEGADGHYNEPFVREDYKVQAFDDSTGEAERLEKVVGLILGHIKETMASTANRPVKFVIKDMPSWFSAYSLEKLTEICPNFVALFRDPMLQVRSYTLRRVNDITCKQNGSNKYSEDETFGLLKVDTDAAAKMRADIAAELLHTWDSYGKAVVLLDKLNVPMVMVDASELLKAPESFLRQISKETGLRYSDKMINDWSRSKEIVCRCRELDPTGVHGYFEDVASSNGFRPVGIDKSKKLTPEDFPKEFAEVFTKANGIYGALLSRPELVRATPEAEVESPVAEVKKVTETSSSTRTT